MVQIDTKKDALDRFADWFTNVMVGMCVCIFAVMVFSVTYGVLGRYLTFVKAPRWTQELAILCMTWLCFVGAGAAIKDDRHVRMTVIERIVSPKTAYRLKVFAYVVLAVVNVFWIIYGMQTALLSSTAKMAATGWPLSITYYSFVVGGVYGFCMAVYRIIKGVNV